MRNLKSNKAVLQAYMLNWILSDKPKVLVFEDEKTGSDAIVALEGTLKIIKTDKQ